MKHFLTLITLLFFAFSYGQENIDETSTKEFHNIQIGFNFSPNISYRTLKNNDGSSISESILKNRNSREMIKFGYSAGVNVCFHIKKFVGIETGIQYDNMGYKTEKFDVFQIGIERQPEQVKIIYNYNYLTIPLKANFMVGKKNVRFFSSVGVNTHFLITDKQKAILYYADNQTEKQSSTSNNDFNKINVSPIVSLGIDYKINDRMNLRIAPSFSYGVIKTIDTPITEHLYNGGVNVQYLFGL